VGLGVKARSPHGGVTGRAVGGGGWVRGVTHIPSAPAECERDMLVNRGEKKGPQKNSRVFGGQWVSGLLYTSTKGPRGGVYQKRHWLRRSIRIGGWNEEDCVDLVSRGFTRDSRYGG
jgi:hypothetical protein